MLFLLELRATVKRLSDSVRKGLCSELLFQLEAIDRGFEVFIPLGHYSSADVIVRQPGEVPIAVQVKKARKTSSGGWRFQACKMRHIKGDTIRTSYKDQAFDVFAVHVQDGVKNWVQFFPLNKIRHKRCLTFQEKSPEITINNWHDLKKDEP